ncbi:hypothetical protein P7K49_036172, partial [Saguinus oedipus]
NLVETGKGSRDPRDATGRRGHGPWRQRSGPAVHTEQSSGDGVPGPSASHRPAQDRRRRGLSGAVRPSPTRWGGGGRPLVFRPCAAPRDRGGLAGPSRRAPFRSFPGRPD